MAHGSQLPCNGDGICMLCKKKPSQEETLTCKTCVTPWHVNCLSSPPETLSATLQWECPDCSPPDTTTADAQVTAAPTQSVASDDAGSGGSGNLIAAIRAIEADKSLTDQQKAKKRQNLLSGNAGSKADLDESKSKDKKKKNASGGGNEVLDLFDDNFKCSFCMQLPERPVTTECGHSFCLKCFQKWVGQGKRTCAKCRSAIPPKMASQPRINATLVEAIRMAKMSTPTTTQGPLKVTHFIHNQNRPDKPFTTERAKKTGKANACSGKIFVTIPSDHFGPILAENDPDRNQGVLVGECWEDRMECRQWGAHFPHVAGIAGQADYGAQSVALSGGYQDDEDNGEWFLYTGSGGRDLSGNKRTNKNQSFDQTFVKYNEALRISCKKGYPVRVVRSHKEKRSSYAPEAGVRYDGVYRIEKCWRKVGIQGFKVCRYLFVRCDNSPAPWASEEHGDRPRSLPDIKELKQATDVTVRKENPSWDYDEEEGCWKWKKPPPISRKPAETGNPEDRKRARKGKKQGQHLTVREKLLKEFSCQICRKVMTLPLTTPCAHNFCKPCLEGAFAGKTFVRERTCQGRRTLRAQKNVLKCPSCPTDISDFLQNPQVNRELKDVIENLQRKTDEDIDENEESVDDSNEEENETEEENEAGEENEAEEVTMEDPEANIPEILEGGKMKKETIEFLECRTKTEENVESIDGGIASEDKSKSDENVDGTEENPSDKEKPEAIVEDTKSTQVSDISEGDDKEMQDDENENKQRRTSKRKNTNGGGNNMSKVDGRKKAKSSDPSNEEKTEAMVEGTKDSPQVSDAPEGGNKEMQDDDNDSKQRRTSKRNKTGESNLSKVDSRKKGKLSGKELDAVTDANNGKKDLETRKTEVKPKQSLKRKKANGENTTPVRRARTRSMTAKGVADEGNISPSSPLHLRPDDDDFA